MTPLRILVFANGVVPDLNAAASLPAPGDLIICADGGARHALALGLHPDVVIGDLDSISPKDLAHVKAQGAAVIRHPRDKDATDLELALSYALDLHPAAILIVGGLGDRLDHTLGSLALLLDPRLAGIACSLDDGIECVLLCRDRVDVDGGPGDQVSLIPWGGPVSGVVTDGLKWPLRGEGLAADRSRGISNELLASTAHIQVESGNLLVVRRRKPNSLD